MQDLRFTQADSDKLIQLLNIVAEQATFHNLKVADIIKIYGLLSFTQKTLIEKIKANIIEITEIRELKPSVKNEKPTKAKR